MMRIVTVTLTVLVFSAVYGQQRGGNVRLGRMLWVEALQIKSQSDIKSLVANCKEAKIDTLIVSVKSEDGRIFWQSVEFKDAVADVVKRLDMLGVLLKEAHKVGIRVHAALCALEEDSKTSAALKRHPEWAMLNVEGKTALNTVWMCPARRGGYVDKWLLPLIEELLRRYDVDGLHLYGLFYPAADALCFCNWCLDGLYKWMCFGGGVIESKRTDWRVRGSLKPKGWEEASRKEKVEFLLKGSSVDGKMSDMDFFFYEYRCAAIRRIIKDVSALVHRIDPETSFSASVFANAEKAARFAGQRWTDWKHYLDFIVVDMSRVYYPHSFNDYLKYLKEDVARIKEQTAGETYAYISLPIDALYLELFSALDGMERWLKNLKEKKEEAYMKIEEHYSVVAERLKTSDVLLMKKMALALRSLKRAVKTGEGLEKAVSTIKRYIGNLRNSAPKGFYTPKRLIKTLLALQSGGADGVVLISAETVEKFNFWDELVEVFSRSDGNVFLKRPLTARPCVGALRGLRTAEKVIVSLKERIERAEEEAMELTRRLRKVEAEKTDVEEKLKALSTELADLRKREEDLNTRLLESENTIERLKDELERERSTASAKKKALEEALREEVDKRHTVEDRLRTLQTQLNRVQTEVRDYLMKLSEDAERLGEERGQERMTVIIAFMVAAVAFAIALIVSVALRRRPPRED